MKFPRKEVKHTCDKLHCRTNEVLIEHLKFELEKALRAEKLARKSRARAARSDADDVFGGGGRPVLWR